MKGSEPTVEPKRTSDRLERLPRARAASTMASACALQITAASRTTIVAATRCAQKESVVVVGFRSLPSHKQVTKQD